MTLDERIRQLMELLSQVKLRPVASSSSARDPKTVHMPPVTVPFDPEVTVVDDDVATPETKVVPPAPESNPHESRSRLIAAERAEIDYDLDEDTKTGFDSESTKAAFTDDAMVPHGLEEEDTDVSPGSSRRPVLPDDVAPALPDVEWEPNDETSPPESGPHMAADAVDHDDVTGIRTASSILGPDGKPHSIKPASTVSHAKDGAEVGSGNEPTFGDVLDASLAL